MVKIIQKTVPASKYSIKCPNVVTMRGITVHNTANDTSALNEIEETEEPIEEEVS